MEELRKKVMDLISSATTLERIGNIEDRLKTTPHINRRTKLGRELTEELLQEANKKALEIQKTELPF